MILSSFRQVSLPLLALSCTPAIVRSVPTLPPLPVTVDVAIVGAGLSGLTAASNLLAAKKTVLVFEARDRVGGKVFNHPLKNGGVTEVGAEFVGPTQDHVLKLIKDLGLETFETYNTGDSVLWRNNTRTVYTPDPALGGAPPVDGASLLEVAAAQQQLDEWAATIKPSSPFSHPKAKEWDSITFEDFIHKAAPSADAKYVLTMACKSYLSVEPREVSLLYMLISIASAGNETTSGSLTRLVTVKGGGQESRVIGGTGLIPTRLAERVKPERIVLNSPVISITKTGSGYDVKSKHHTVHAKFVVLALAPPLLEKITFTPALPEARSALNKNMKMPALGKGIAIYKSPFWRTPTTAQKSGLSAQVLSDAGTVRATFDSTPHPSTKPPFAAIMAFLLDDEMRALDALDVPAAQAKIVDDFTRYFGAPAKDLDEFVLQRWDLEPYILGGPSAVAGPGVLSKYGDALRQPVDGLHFAGTETSEYWMGYMDGAIRSGERVAKEIIMAKTTV